MNNQMISKEDFLTKIEINETTLEQWQKNGLIKPIGITDDNIPFYSILSIEKAINIKKFFELGYKLEDIKRIIKKVGYPKKYENNEDKDLIIEYLTVGNLAEKVGVSPRTIKHWEDKGIIEPDMRSEGGFRLYSKIYIYLCKLVMDLQLFGYTLEEIKVISDYFRDFLAIENNIEVYSIEKQVEKLNSMLEAIEKLYIKMNQLTNGIERWEELLKKKKKEVANLLIINKKRMDIKGEKNE